MTPRRLLASAARPCLAVFVTGAALLALSAVFAVAASLLFVPLFDRALLAGDVGLVAAIAGIQLLLMAGRALAAAVGTVRLARVGASVAEFLSDHLYGAMIRQPLAYFIDTGRGASLQLLREDVAVFETGAGFLAGQALVAGLQVSAGLLVTGFIEVLLVPLALLGLFGVVIWSRLAVRWQGEDLHREIDANVRVAEAMLRGLGIDGALLRTEAQPEWIEGRVRAALRRHARDVVRRRSRSTWAHEASALTIAAAQFGFFLAGGALLAAGSLSVGELIAAAALLTLMTGGGQQLMGAISGLADASLRLGRMAHVLGGLETLGGTGADSGLETHEDRLVEPPEIRFEKVSLAYGDRIEAIHEASFVCPPGKFTVLVGPSGAGKSSLLYLLLRLVTAESGRITIDGTGIKTLAPSRLWRITGFVPQNPPFFAATIRENLLLGRDADDARLRAACQETGILSRILDAPDGFDTEIGEDGYRFSAGERKRFALARSLIGEPRLIVLDEPTGDIDAVSEKVIIEALRRLADIGTTVIAATHSAALAEAADHLIRVESGHVVSRRP